MRNATRSAALLAAALLPTAATAWAGSAQAVDTRPAVPPDPQCTDVQTHFKANMSLVYPYGGGDPSNVAGWVALQWSPSCRIERAVVGLNHPLPRGKAAFGYLSRSSQDGSVDCNVAVGGSGCATAFVNSRNIQFYAGANLYTVGSTGNTPFYEGTTPIW